MITDLINEYKNKIMEYTLGDEKDEYGELYSEVYQYEWCEFIFHLRKSIELLKPSKLELTPEILTYLIIDKWSGVWCDKEDLEIDKLRVLSKTIIEEMI
ncbi:hypothetical protein ACV3OO_11645 [Clostridium perfringens]